MENRLCKLLGIEIPVISGGMVWCSGWRLAAAVGNNGGLGLIGAGSMHPDNLRDHIRKCRIATAGNPFGVNVPLLYPQIDAVMEIILHEDVPVVVTSAGSPKKWTETLRSRGTKVLHVVSSQAFALKAEEAGVDAIIAEGFEAGGHNGREETTTLCLIPAVADAVKIPVVAAGGIFDGRGAAAALALGADGVQIGTRFALSDESSAHDEFKKHCRSANEGDTVLTLKQLAPTRMLRNTFFQAVQEAEARGASKDEIQALLGKGRAKKGIFEGDLTEGELEIGQIVSMIRQPETVAAIINDIRKTYNNAVAKLPVTLL